GSMADRFTKPVGIGYVRVEPWPDEIEPPTHYPGARPAVAAAGGMPAFVNGRRDHDDREQNQEEERLIQQRPDALTDPMHEEQPAVEGNEPDQRRRHHQRPEEGPEDRGDRIHQSRRY